MLLPDCRIAGTNRSMFIDLGPASHPITRGVAARAVRRGKPAGETGFLGDNTCF